MAEYTPLKNEREDRDIYRYIGPSDGDKEDERESLDIDSMLRVCGWTEGKQDHWSREVDGEREELVNPHYAFMRLEFIRSCVNNPEDYGRTRTVKENEEYKQMLEFAEKLCATIPPGYQERYLPEGADPMKWLGENEIHPLSKIRWVPLDGSKPIEMF